MKLDLTVSTGKLTPWLSQFSTKLKEIPDVYINIELGKGDCVIIEQMETLCWEIDIPKNRLEVTFGSGPKMVFNIVGYDNALNILVDVVRLTLYKLTGERKYIVEIREPTNDTKNIEIEKLVVEPREFGTTQAYFFTLKYRYPGTFRYIEGYVIVDPQNDIYVAVTKPEYINGFKTRIFTLINAQLTVEGAKNAVMVAISEIEDKILSEIGLHASAYV